MTIWTDVSRTEFSIRNLAVGAWSTRVLEAGKRGSPLILMHGTGGHLEAFAKNLAPLSERHRVIAYDFPGHGWSTTAERDLELSDYVDHLAAMMDLLGIEDAHLSGESLGGWVAIKFAAAHPERVRSMMLNTPGGTMATPEVMERIRELSQMAADDPSEERVRARLEWLMADPASVTEELVVVRQAIYSRPGFARSMRHILCLQDPDIRRRNLVTDDELLGIESPALVVWTSDDPSGPASAGLHIAQTLPHADFRLIADAGHWPQWEQPEEFTNITMEFLRNADTRREEP